MILLELRSFNSGSPSMCLQGTDSMRAFSVAVTACYCTEIFCFCFSHLRTQSLHLHTMSGVQWVCTEPEETYKQWIWRNKLKTDCKFYWMVNHGILTFFKRQQDAFKWGLSETKRQNKKAGWRCGSVIKHLPRLCAIFCTIKRKWESKPSNSQILRNTRGRDTSQKTAAVSTSDWGNSLLYNVLPLQAWGPTWVSFPKPIEKNPGMVACAYKLSSGEAETGGSLDLPLV